ncbi:helix-turn-helix transcriptional regulator [Kribbella sp. NPDC023855]|uniref:helix-turn-helix domain-containing protein n=1 Tax=Kribbella sp. NPDC023855 TaxID=3154698 RepID=UPI0033E0C2CC
MTDTPAQRIGANVRAEMARRGISQVAIASKLGLPQTSVSKRLRGEVAFNVDELTAVADHLGVPLAALLAEQPATT